jgi:hypothetical protein
MSIDLFQGLKALLEKDEVLSEHLQGIVTVGTSQKHYPFLIVDIQEEKTDPLGFTKGTLRLILMSRYEGQLETTRLQKHLKTCLMSPLATATSMYTLKLQEMSHKTTLDPVLHRVTLACFYREFPKP